MTSTSFNIGLSDGRNSSKVLKPPGGGTSDMFASPPDQADSPRKARAPSNLQLGDSGAAVDVDVPVFKSGNNSQSRFFGEGDAHVPTSRKTQTASNTSNMPWLDQAPPTKIRSQVAPVQITAVQDSNHQVLDNSLKSGANPVTGDGYETGKSSETSPQNGNGPSTVLRNRVPPGGYSSGLW